MYWLVKAFIGFGFEIIAERKSWPQEHDILESVRGPGLDTVQLSLALAPGFPKRSHFQVQSGNSFLQFSVRIDTGQSNMACLLVG